MARIDTASVVADAKAKETRIGIGLTLGDVPQQHPCPICGVPTRVLALSYEVPYVAAGEPWTAKCSTVPGYRCDECDVESYSLEGTLGALEGILAVVRQANDASAEKRIKASVRAAQQQLTKR